jgi:cytochrome b involved in lipid metabolism
MVTVYKILRITAWVLVLATILTLASGFLTTKYFLAPWLGYKSAYYIHTIVIPLVFVPLFYLHSLTGLFALISRQQKLNKKYAKIFTGVVWTSIFVLFVYFYMAQNPMTGAAPMNNSANQINNTPTGQASVSLTLQEISQHNLAADCWMIINNKVYNLTNYLNAHPGGVNAILPYCGQDGTNAFATKNQGVPHSSAADNLLSSFYLGDVGQAIGSQQIQNVQSQTQNIPSSGRGNEDDD